MALDVARTLNISDFVSRTKRDGFSRLNRIAVKINPPAAILNSATINDLTSLTYYAESVSIPGMELLTNELYLGGAPTTYPTRSDFRPGSTISFLVDDNMSQRLFFDAWLNYINPKERGFDLRYRDDYIGKITVLQISEAGDRVSYGVEMFEAYPTSVGEIRGNWSEQEVVRLDVNFSYRFWRNLTQSEVFADNELNELFNVTVTGTRKDSLILDSVTVTGTKKVRSKEELLDVTVTGTRRG